MVSTVGEGPGRGILLRTSPAVLALTLGALIFRTIFSRHKRTITFSCRQRPVFPILGGMLARAPMRFNLLGTSNTRFRIV